MVTDCISLLYLTTRLKTISSSLIELELAQKINAEIKNSYAAHATIRMLDFINELLNL